MSSNIEYELHKLEGTIEDVGPRLPVAEGIDKNSDAVFRGTVTMRLHEGSAELINVYLPPAIDAWLRPGLQCKLYVAEGEANVGTPASGVCAVNGPFCHVFAIEAERKCLSAVRDTASHFGALKRFGVEKIMPWVALALMLSVVVIGLPFLFYFATLTVLALAVRTPSVVELRTFLGRKGFPTRCGRTA
jgi:hypothetical protein